MLAAKEISVDAEITAVLSEFGDIFALKGTKSGIWQIWNLQIWGEKRDRNLTNKHNFDVLCS